MLRHSIACSLRSVVSSKWLRIGGTAAGLYLVVHNVDLASAGRTLRHAQPGWVLLGVFLTGLATLSAVAQWSVLLRGVGHRIRPRRLVGLHLEGMFVGQVFPAAVGGDAMRAVAITPQTGVGTAVASLTASRMAGATGMAVWGLAGTFMVRDWVGVPGMIGAAAFAAAMLATWAVALCADSVVRRIDPRRGRIRPWLRGVLTPFAQAFGSLRRHPAVLARCALFAAAGWGVNLLALTAFARSIGIHADWSVFAVAIPVTLVATLSPVSLNGYGVREGVLVGLLAHAGVDPSNAGAFSVLVDLQVLPLVLAGAAVWFSRARRGRLAVVDPAPSARLGPAAVAGRALLPAA